MGRPKEKNEETKKKAGTRLSSFSPILFVGWPSRYGRARDVCVRVTHVEVGKETGMTSHLFPGVAFISCQGDESIVPLAACLCLAACLLDYGEAMNEILRAL